MEQCKPVRQGGIGTLLRQMQDRKLTGQKFRQIV